MATQTKPLKAFPYKDLRLTPEQAEELVQRIETLRGALTDMIGLSGHLMSLDDASIANIASHLALAGARLDDEAAFIWGRRSAPDDTGMWRIEVEWLVKAEHPVEEQPAPTPEQVEELREQLRATVPPGLLEALQAQLIAEAEAEATDEEGN